MQQQRTIPRICEQCEAPFLAKATLVAAGQARYCSLECYFVYRRTRDQHALFWARVNKDGPVPAHRPELGPCWLWTGAPEKDGYGRIYINGRQMKAHRASWEMHHGTIAAGLLVCHACDNPPCVNPAHLFLGTTADNNRDMKHKGHYVHVNGEAHGLTTLTEAQVREIRNSWAARGVLQRELAARYGVSQTTIGRIIRRETWGHVC